MQRKQFVSAVMGAGAALAAAGAALAATSAPVATGMPQYTSPCLPRHRFAGGGLANPYNTPAPGSSPNQSVLLEEVERHLFRLIGMLERDPNDYAGHKQQAIGYLQQALTQLQDALANAGANPLYPIQSQP